MSYSFLLDSGTDAQKLIAAVRDEIGDVTASADEDGGTEGLHYHFSDARINRRIQQFAVGSRTDEDVILLASASLLDTWASTLLVVLGDKTTLSQSNEASKTAKEMRDHAATCRQRVADSEAAAADANNDGVSDGYVSPQSCSVATITSW